jgi:hypothetical protein
MVSQRRLSPVLSACMVSFALTGPAAANLITSEAAFSGSAQVIDFNGFGPGFTTITGALPIGSASTGNITLSGTGETRVIGTGNFGLAENGLWTDAKSGYVAAGGSTVSGGGSLTFHFDEPVKAVGGFMNYGLPPALPLFTIAALAGDGSVLESYDINLFAPINTPGGINEGAFRGIVRDKADIASFRLSGAGFVLDDLTFAAIPEPGTMFLVLLGAVNLVGAILRQRRS